MKTPALVAACVFTAWGLFYVQIVQCVVFFFNSLWKVFFPPYNWVKLLTTVKWFHGSLIVRTMQIKINHICVKFFEYWSLIICRERFCLYFISINIWAKLNTLCGLCCFLVTTEKIMTGKKLLRDDVMCFLTVQMKINLSQMLFKYI